MQNTKTDTPTKKQAHKDMECVAQALVCSDTHYKRINMYRLATEPTSNLLNEHNVAKDVSL